MKGVLAFLKINPILIVAVIVAIGSVVWLLMISGEGSEFVKKLDSRQSIAGQLDKFTKVTVTMPPDTTDGEAKSVTVAINNKGIDALEAGYEKMQTEFLNIFELASQYNKSNYRPIDDNLFPVPSKSSKLFYAKNIYRDYFRRLMLPFSADVKVEPRLDAGKPPTKEEINAVIERAKEDFLGGFALAKGAGQLNESQKAELARQVRNALINMLKDRARSIHIYAETDPESKEFPFTIDGWSNPKQDLTPDIAEVWESQMKLWYTQALCWLIMDINAVHDPQSNVLNRPIKRLHELTVVPGYVGVNSTGGMNGGTGVKAASKGGKDAPKTPGTLSGKPAKGLGDADAALPSDFGISPTGRRSNPIYDVRHARIKMIVDWEQFPVFLHKLNDSNFMTVLSVQIEDVDEYEHLREGFVYGKNDVVQVDMVIESLWLRKWTQEFMPPKVKTSLGIATGAPGK